MTFAFSRWVAAPSPSRWSFARAAASALPGERVSVIATFDCYRGRFLMHCHNLVHEDLGMMMNYEIV